MARTKVKDKGYVQPKDKADFSNQTGWDDCTHCYLQVIRHHKCMRMSCCGNEAFLHSSWTLTFLSLPGYEEVAVCHTVTQKTPWNSIWVQIKMNLYKSDCNCISDRHQMWFRSDLRMVMFGYVWTFSPHIYLDWFSEYLDLYQDWRLIVWTTRIRRCFEMRLL